MASKHTTTPSTHSRLRENRAAKLLAARAAHPAGRAARACPLLFGHLDRHPYVRRVLRAPGRALQYHPGPALPVPEQYVPGGAGGADLRHPGAEGLSLAHRRGGHGKDDAAPPPPGHARPERPDRPPDEPDGQLRRDPRVHPDRARHPDRGDGQARPLPPSERVPDRARPRRRQRRPADRRGAGPRCERPRAAPPAVEPRDGTREDPPDPLRRAARARDEVRQLFLGGSPRSRQRHGAGV